MYRGLICLVPFVVPVLILTSTAQAGEATADTFVRGADNGDTNYGSGGSVTIKNANGNSYDRKGYIRFDIAGKTSEASLELTVSTNNNGGGGTIPQTFTVEVYGLAESLDHTWTETDITWNNAPGNDTSSSNFTADATLLGFFVVEPLPVGNVVSFSDPALDDLINSDTDGQITILVRRTPGASSSHNLAFASKENTSGYSPPTLNMAAATRASRPSPADGDIVEATWATLSWSPSPSAASHDVYLGDNFDDVNSATPDSPVFQLNQSGELIIVGFFGYPFPDGLVAGTTYYWRIDEVNDADPNSPWKGPVWSFSIPPRKAHDPSPPDGARFVDTDIELSWTMGLNAKLHNIVFGDGFDDVNSAPAGIPASDTTFTPGTLEKGKTYYWRVDEVDPPTTVKGKVWSFTTKPDILITDPNLVAWYKFEAGEGTKVIDFSGHDNNGDIVPSPSGTVQWVPGQFNLALEFLGDNLGHVELPPGIVTSASGSIMMWVNTDQTGNAGMLWYGTETNGDGFGGQNEIHIHVGDPGDLGFHIEGATDVGLGGPQIAGEGWNHVAVTWDTVDGCRLYFNGAEVDFQAHNNTVVDLAVIRLGRPVDTGYGNRYYDGLMDDVRLFDHAITADHVNEIVTQGEDPRRASAPKPRLGALVGLDEALPLSWLAGELATTHDVYFGLDRDAVENADTSDTTGVYRGSQNTTTYSPPEGVEWGGGPYYWRIDENYNDGTVSEGGIWNFSVADFIPIDDFERYTNDDVAGEAIWQTWDDGYADAANGSQVGYEFPTYVEQTILHSGSQSMPLHYNNTAGVTNSEVSLKLDSQRDWTKHGV
ncbi:MAG: LamG domain-containing protein, partial [Phycisphaerales bacterium]